MTKPTIDERIEALVHSLELEQLERRELAAKHEALDKREREGRRAIMAGIAAYFRIIDADENGDRPEEE